jgi:predicted MFS family arabinose efflux permease
MSHEANPDLIASSGSQVAFDNSPQARATEAKIIFLIGAVQCINILDFMMVMPLGPDFMNALGIDSSEIGKIGGSYTAAAAVSGIIGARFLDRFDRRKALAVSMLGLALGTVAGGFATGLGTLILARIVAGIFGGPATSLSLAIVADVIPRERMGKAMGAVMSAFSVASVLGVPLGLQLALWFDWRAPFFFVAGLGLLITANAIFWLPPMRGHLEKKKNAPQVSFSQFFKRPTFLLSYSIIAAASISGFILIPNISPYVQHNLHYPREWMGLLYALGGIASFAAMRLIGKWVDRFGSFMMGMVGGFLLAASVYVGFASHWPGVSVEALYIVFMVAMSFRNVSMNTLSSKVPEPQERAGFMSVQSAVQHLTSALAAFLSSEILYVLPNGKLEGIEYVAWICIALSLFLPFLMLLLERRLKANALSVASSAPQAKPTAA